MKKILNSDQNYPIIINNNKIIDGAHRFTKAFINKKKSIEVYNFDNNLLKKFYLCNDDKLLKKYNTHVQIELFFKNFFK